MFDWLYSISAESWLALVAGMIITRFVVESGLDWLNLQNIRQAPEVVPVGLRVSVDVLKKGSSYHSVLMRVSLWRRLAATLFFGWVVFGGILPSLASWVDLTGLAESHQFVLYFGALGLLFFVFSLPWGWHRTFSVEERFGFNKQKPASWWLDVAKKLLVAACFGIPLAYAAFWCLVLSESWWWLYLSLLFILWGALVMWLFPTVIVPLFNRLTPLPEGELSSRLESLAERERFACRGIFVLDASQRSGHSNAFFAGLFQPRIVLFDTLVEEISPQECEAVLAHEIGHYKLGHMLWNLLAASITQIMRFFVLSLILIAPKWSVAFGFNQPSLAGEIALLLLLSGPLFFFLSPLSAMLSRRFEYQADAFACRAVGESKPLETALLSLSKHNLANFHPHRLFSIYHHSHPTLVERIAAMAKLQKV